MSCQNAPIVNLHHHLHRIDVYPFPCSIVNITMSSAVFACSSRCHSFSYDGCRDAFFCWHFDRTYCYRSHHLPYIKFLVLLNLVTLIINLDDGFQKDIMEKFLSQFDINIRPIAQQTHEVNPIEPRHLTIQSMF